MKRHNPYSSDLPGRYPVTAELLALAEQAVAHLWNERRAQRGLPPTEDRSGSCKFAALLARELFGGRVAGNLEHVFVLREGQVIDLNRHQQDVIELDSGAHRACEYTLNHRDYIESLKSCEPRAQRWVCWFDEQMRDRRIALPLNQELAPAICA